jgi:hypothetical protein
MRDKSLRESALVLEGEGIITVVEEGYEMNEGWTVGWQNVYQPSEGVHPSLK